MNLQGLVRQVSHNVTRLFPIIEQVLLDQHKKLLHKKTTYESADSVYGSYKNFTVINFTVCCVLFRP